MVRRRPIGRPPRRLIAAIAMGSILLMGSADLKSCATSSSGDTTSTTPSPTASSSNNDARDAGIAIAAVAVVATVVLIEVHNAHHRLKGCVVAGPDGLALQTLKDGKTTTFALQGDVAGTHPGDLVQFKGSHIKKATDSAGDSVFRVEKLRKNFGPCNINEK